MIYSVKLTQSAERDLAEIGTYIEENDSPQAARHVLREIAAMSFRLEQAPLRGSVPPELASMGNQDFRQLHFKPYRIIYKVDGATVYVHGVFDGRRNLQDLLERRLLR